MEVTFADGASEQYDDQLFASGAQGELYLSTDRRHVAKLYARSSGANAERVNAVVGQYNVTGNDPYWAELYGWPDKRIVSPSLGVRMPFVTGLTRLDHFLYPGAYNRLPSDKRGWWIGRVAVAAKLSRALNALASKGITHSDISEMNIMVDLFAGQVRIIDCDAIVVPGELAPEVVGHHGYMAPELMSGRQQQPSAMTDRHALAVLLYRLLLYRHPLDGPLIHANEPDLDDVLRYGAKALFVEHPTDHSNRPANIQVAIDTLTPRVRELFLQAFVSGLHEPARRPSPAMWDEALLEMFDCVVPCSNPHCSQRFFVAPHKRGERLRCSLCSHDVQGPASLPYIQLLSPRDRVSLSAQGASSSSGRQLVGWPGRPLFPWHANSDSVPVPRQGRLPETWPIGMFEYDAESEQWYLLNLNIENLSVLDTGHIVPPQTRVSLHDGLQLRLGDSMNAYTALITVERGASSAHATIVRLPQIDTANAKPWPLLRATQADQSWQPGQPVSLALYSFSRDAYPTVNVSSQVNAGSRQVVPSQPQSKAAHQTIFVSHSHTDLEFCRAFVSGLKSAGCDVWYDEKGLSAGAAWVETIEHEIETRDLFVVILTPDAWGSYWVQEEIRLALTRRRRIIPVLLKPTEASGFILNRQWVNVVGMDASAAAQHFLSAYDQ